MRPHFLHNALPEFVTTFLVNRFIANHRDFTSTGRDENQHRITLAGLVHTESAKLPLRRNEGITLQLATLDQNAKLSRRFGFRFADHLHDTVCLEFAEKFSRSHLSPP